MCVVSQSGVAGMEFGGRAASHHRQTNGHYHMLRLVHSSSLLSLFLSLLPLLQLPLPVMKFTPSALANLLRPIRSTKMALCLGPGQDFERVRIGGAICTTFSKTMTMTMTWDVCELSKRFGNTSSWQHWQCESTFKHTHAYSRWHKSSCEHALRSANT